MVKQGIINIWVHLICVGLLAAMLLSQPASAADELLVFGYQDVPEKVAGDREAVDRIAFIQHIEYLRMHGYVFVSMNDVITAHNGGKPLPGNAVLLTFDNAYQSFYEFVYPVLQLYGYPCVLSVVTSWIGDPPADIPAPLMNWKELGEVARSDLVTIASGTHGLHRDIVFDAAGNTGNAVTSLAWDNFTGKRETESSYRERIAGDLRMSRSVLRAKLDVDASTLVWPGGRCNVPALEEAAALGFTACFTDNEITAPTSNPVVMPRRRVVMNPPVSDFRTLLEQPCDTRDNIRAVRVDLDSLFSMDTVRLERNIDVFLTRMESLGVSTVYLRACTDPDGNGAVNEAYFPNRVIPMRADLFGRIAGELAGLGIDVYASMPVLRVAIPGLSDRSLVHERNKAGTHPSRDMCRVSPFDDESVSMISILYEDVAASAPITGVVFEEDAYLAGREDFSDAALQKYLTIAGGVEVPVRDLDEELQKAWMREKTKRLTDITRRYMASVRKWRPDARSVRIIYPRVVLDPRAELEYAQNYDVCLEIYDEVVVMAYPRNEGVMADNRWLRKLVDAAKGTNRGIERTVFMVQAYDYDAAAPINAEIMRRWFREMVAAGALHIAYASDDYINGVPSLETVRMMISKDSYPADGE